LIRLVIHPDGDRWMVDVVESAGSPTPSAAEKMRRQRLGWRPCIDQRLMAVACPKTATFDLALHTTPRLP
jgi:hypothetical protein